MDPFQRRGGVLHAEDINLEALAASVGTPFYCYSETALRRRYRAFHGAFADWRGPSPLTAFSVKSNPNSAVRRVMALDGGGADVVWGGVLRRGRGAGTPGERIVFSGVGKTRDEMALALDENVLLFNVESESELDALGATAREKGATAPIAFRVNPDIEAGGHAKISTGKAEDKFGVPIDAARALYARAAALEGVAVRGVDVHIGSQITDLRPFEDAYRRIVSLIEDLRADGHAIECVDVGGGLGVPYKEGAPAPSVAAYAALVRRMIEPLGVKPIFEPGRFLSAPAGLLVARVIYVKQGASKRFLILDAGMNDLLRPALYDAEHEITPIRASARKGSREKYDVVGPVCETGDLFARDVALPPIEEDDLVAFKTVGAYGASLASQYNARPLAPEVLVCGDHWDLVRRRPTFEDMAAMERVPSRLSRPSAGSEARLGREEN